MSRASIVTAAAIVIAAVCFVSGLHAAVPLKLLHARELRKIAARDSGKVVLVNLWATWCGECKEEMPGLLRLQQELADSGFVLILFSADEIEDSVKVVKYLDSLGVKFQTYLKADLTDDELIAGLDPSWSGALPTSLIVDRHGKLVKQVVGAKQYEYFRKGVVSLLKP